MAIAYGLGELPGRSIAEAADMVLSETGDLPHIPQLSARGLGSGAVGRTAGLMEVINIDRGPRSWIMTQRPQLLTRRTWDLLERDLDECEATWGSHLGSLKLQVAGPWTLAASIELANGRRALTDSGALRDLTEALIAGVNTHIGKVGARFGAEVHVQIDEPLLSDVVHGRLAGTSDFDPVRAVHPSDAGERLARVVDGLDTDDVYLNQTGYLPEWEIAQAVRATTQVSLGQVTGTTQLDSIGQALSDGKRIGLGVGRGDAREKAIEIARFFDHLGIPRILLTHAVDIHPDGGIADGDIKEAGHAYAEAAEIAAILTRDAGDL